MPGIFQEQNLCIFKKRNRDCTELCAIAPVGESNFHEADRLQCQDEGLIPLFASGLRGKDDDLGPIKFKSQGVNSPLQMGKGRKQAYTG